jgi:hypothetical protein
VVERHINAPEYDGHHLVRPVENGPKPVPGDKAALIRRGGRTLEAGCYLELCQCRDIDPRKLPNLDYAHFSPNCLSVSTTGKNLRNQDNDYLGLETDDDCCEYNMDLAWIVDVIKDQLSRNGNSQFKFTIEAPRGVARHIVFYKLVETSRKMGGCGGTRCELFYCKFGVEYPKPTYIWTNIESMIAELSGPKHRYICCDAHPCKLGPGQHERLGHGDVAVKDAAAFPEDLVRFLCDHVVVKSCAHRRNDAD